MTKDWTDALFFKLHNLQNENAGKIDMNNVDDVIRQFLEIISTHITTTQQHEIYHQIEMISAQIISLKKDVSNISEEVLDENFIPQVTMELRSIINQTERSVTNILDLSDEVTRLCDEIPDLKLREELMVKAVRILENCNFQDLTGQRIKKIIDRLTEIESTIYKMLHALRPSKDLRTKQTPADKHLLNGPQEEHNCPSQVEVDDLFNSL